MKSFLKIVDRKILDPETRAKGVSFAYMAVAVLLLLHHVYVTVYHKEVLTGARDLYIPFILFAGASFFMGRLWKDKLFWVFSALLVLKVVRTAMFGAYAVEVSVTYFVLSVYAFFICYAVARVLPRDLWRPFLLILCFLWTLAAVVFAAFGLRVACSGVPIFNLGTEAFTINLDNRLYLIYHAVSSGVILAVSMSVALLGCILSKNAVLRGFFAGAAVVIFFTCSLTGTRTAFVMSGVNLALLLYIPLRDRLKPGSLKDGGKSLGKYALLFLFFLLITGAAAWLQSRSANLLPYLKARSGLLVSNAAAEEEAALYEINMRGFDLSADEYGFLNGRFEHWGYVLRAVFSDPETLFLGRSVFLTMDPVNALRAEAELMPLYHCHNTFLQYLLENGLPGLLLYGAFIFTFVFHAIRVLRNRNLPFWQRALPVGGLICVLEGLVDNTCHVNFGYPQMTALFLFAGFTITLSRQECAKRP